MLTPWRVVNMHMSDILGGYTFFNERFDGPCEREVPATNGQLFEWVTTDEPRFVDRGEVTRTVFASDSKILEINSKTGLYPLYVAYSLYRQRKKDFEATGGLIDDPDNYSVEEEQVIWDDILANNVYVICNTPMARRITERTLLGFRKLNMREGNERLNIKSVQLIRRATEDREALISDLLSEGFWRGVKRNKIIMKFGAVVGNPPYQVVNKGNGNGADPIYHTFIDIARAVSPRGTLIHPARFLFNAGKTPKDWNQQFLNDPHVKVIDYWTDSSFIFPGVEINGGIAISYWDTKTNFGKIGFFTAFDELRGILGKVREYNPQSFSSIVSPRELYRITDELYKDNPEMEGRQSAGHKYSFGANIFDVFPELFFRTPPLSTENYAKVFGRKNNQRCYMWIDKRYVSQPEIFNSYKIIISKADGAAGKIGNPIPARLLGKIEIGTPLVAYTDTFLGIGCFGSKYEAEACQKYVKTKFARTLLGTIKVTQDNSRDLWTNVPLQDFTSSSDINWSASVADIDQQLYRKYGLSADEIAFIEKMIKPME